jgi:short-subunit dehydrogenase
MTRILVTGASSGIGAALAREYAEPGASLVLLGRDAARLEAVAADCRGRGAEVQSLVADVRDRPEMKRVVEEAHAAQPIDILIANAGVATGLAPGQILERPEAVRATFAINVAGVFNTVEPAILPMCKRGSGAIVVVGSMAAVRGLPFSPAYSAAKSAVHLYAESLRGVLTPHGVDVSLIVPGWVKTPMSARTKAWQASAITDAEAAQIIRRGLARRKPVIAFPRYMYYSLRFISLLPPRLVDAVMRRFTAEVPETPERETP